MSIEDERQAAEALGVPVVERDEAAELREAVKKWARAKDEYFRSGIKKPTTGDWGAVIDLEDNLRRLVGMEEG